MPRFAYLVHPSSIEEVAAHERWARRLPRFLTAAILDRSSPRVISSFLDQQHEYLGWVVDLRDPEARLVAHPRRLALRAAAAIEMALRAGATVVGLGGSALWNDSDISTACADAGLTTVNGSAAQLLSAVPALECVCRATGRPTHQAVVVLVGGETPVGRSAAFLLARAFNYMVLWGEAPQLDRLAQHIRHESGLSAVRASEMNILGAADLLVLASADVRVLPSPSLWLPRLRAGAVVMDISNPPALLPRVAALRPEVLIIQGGAYSLTGSVQWDRAFFDGGVEATPKGISPVLAEVVAVALSGDAREYGQAAEASLERLHAVDALLSAAGLRVERPRSFGAVLAPEYLESFRPARPRWSGRF